MTLQTPARLYPVLVVTRRWLGTSAVLLMADAARAHMSHRRKNRCVDNRCGSGTFSIYLRAAGRAAGRGLMIVACR